MYQRKMKLVHRWHCTVHTCPPLNLSCIYIYIYIYIIYIYIYIYLYRGKQFISLQTYRHPPMHILTLYNAFNYQIYIMYKLICCVPYLRRNPCQEEILTGWHHGFPLNDNPTILLRFQCGFSPSHSTVKSVKLCLSHWDISSCSDLRKPLKPTRGSCGHMSVIDFP